MFTLRSTVATLISSCYRVNAQVELAVVSAVVGRDVLAQKLALFVCYVRILVVVLGQPAIDENTVINYTVVAGTAILDDSVAFREASERLTVAEIHRRR